MSEIIVKNLKVTYQLNKKQIVDAIKNLNATFEDGKFNVIIGFSGCGKSTLLKTLLGLLSFEGEISLESSLEVIKIMDEIRKQIGVKFPCDE